MKNKYQHNDDGTTFIFVESKSKSFPGKHTITIDTEDWDKVKEYRWGLGIPSSRNNYPYAKTSIPHPDGGWRKRSRAGRRARKEKRRTSLYLHHLLGGKPAERMYTDHINNNGLDNRKENLREATSSQNAANSRSKNNTSRYKGVRKLPDIKSGSRQWQARVKHNYREIHVGCFHTEEEAALAYNEKAVELWGEHAHLNKVEIQ